MELEDKYQSSKKSARVRQCDQCNFTTEHKQSLKRHVKIIHYKIRDYACEQCSFKASTNSNLMQHIKSVHKMELVDKYQSSKKSAGYIGGRKFYKYHS